MSETLLFSFFRNNGEDGLYLATSSDGLSWRAVNGDRPLLQPEVGESKLMRDPSIVAGPDGLFHMVWTTSWQGETIGYSHSRDLRRWAPQRALPVMEHEPGVINCWAPELFADNGEFHIVWASTVREKFPQTAGRAEKEYNHRLYHTRTRDFRRFGPVRLFYDPGFPVIDGALFRDGRRYTMVVKNETLRPPAKYLFLTSADSLDGPWSAPSDRISGEEWAEGPSPLRTGGYWYIYFDRYRARRYGAIRSADLRTWEDISDRTSFPEGMRHGTVFRAPAEVIAALR